MGRPVLSRAAFVGIAVAAVSTVSGNAALAQHVTGFAVNRFEPAGPDSAWMTADSLRFDGHGKPFFAVVTDFAWKPLIVYDAQGHEIAPLVRDQLFAHVDAAVMLWNRVRTDLSLPIALANGGDGAALGTATYQPPDGAGLGDIRLGVDGIVYQRPDRLVVTAVGMQLFLPTGSTAAFTGDGGVRWWPRVSVAGERRAFSWATRVGVQVRPSDGCHCDLAPGSEVDGALAGGWRPRPQWLVGPELTWSHTVSSGAAALRSGTPLELLVGGHWTPKPDWTFTLGLGHGLTNGAGTPGLRVIAGAQYTFSRRPRLPSSE
jgi:OOP family OmpA-OmpF porin